MICSGITLHNGDYDHQLSLTLEKYNNSFYFTISNVYFHLDCLSTCADLVALKFN